MTKKYGTLFLLPNTLGGDIEHQLLLPSLVDETVGNVDGLIAESETGARRYLGRFKTKKPAREMPITLYNKHNKDLEFILEPVLAGEDWGLISDAGVPCVADPGSTLVAYARKKGVKVKALTGPSSIILSLMLSGLPSQNFAFHGYLNRKPEELKGELRGLELISKQQDSTQLFIEAPHRNDALLENILEALSPDTLLSIATNLTQKKEFVDTQTVETWKKMALPNLDKKPTIFLIYAGA